MNASPHKVLLSLVVLAAALCITAALLMFRDANEASHQPPPVGLSGVAIDEARRSNISDDETIVFFPTHAHREGDRWIVPVHAWVYEPELGDLTRDATMLALREALDLEPDGQREVIFNRRARLFLVDNERGKRLTIRWQDRAFELDETTGSEGHLRATVELPGDAIEPGEVIRFTALLPDDDDRVFEGVAHALDSTGLTVISDIDDTVKVSNVTDTSALMRATFFEPFQPVGGMTERYQQWAREDDAAFVYVSSSPWQLYPELKAMLNAAGFPPAAFALKTFRMKDERLADLFADPFERKVVTVADIIERYPDRSYILVGDTGEQDPEVYGEIARRYPDRVRHVYLRDVMPPDQARADDEQFAGAFEGIPETLWTVFRGGLGEKAP